MATCSMVEFSKPVKMESLLPKLMSKRDLSRKKIAVALAASFIWTTFACPAVLAAQVGEASSKLLEAEVSDTEYETAPQSNNEKAAQENSTKTDGQASKDLLTVDDIQIEGNRLISTQNITSVIKTKPGDKFDRDQIMEDLKAVNEMGYFDDKSLQVTPERKSGNRVLLKIRVQENAPITQFSVQGNNLVSSDEISKILNEQLGKPQNINQLSASVDKIEQLYHDKGFMLARVTDVKDFPDGSVSLSVNEGVIDKIEIVGNRKTKDLIIRNALKLKPGSAYNEKQITADLRQLYANGYFQDIKRSLEPSATDPEKFTLKVEVEEKRTGSVGMGGGLDSATGPFGQFSYSENNFRGRGQVLSINSQVGSAMFSGVANNLNNGGQNFIPNARTYNMEASWIEPNLKGTNTSLAVTGFGRSNASMLVDQAQQRTLGASVTLTKPLRKGWSLSTGFTGENTSLRDLGGFLGEQNTLLAMASRAVSTGRAATMDQANMLAGQVRNDQMQGGLYMSIRPTLAFDTRDAAIDPTKGTSIRLSGGPSLGLTGNSFAKLGASVSKFVPVGKSSTLAFNVQGGAGLGGMPQFAQYRLGGWNGVRGYRQFSDLGSGAGLLMSTAEFRTKVPFMPKDGGKVTKFVNDHVKLATFLDAGVVTGGGLNNSLMGRNTLAASVGLGVRLKVPMLGLVRLDYGMPLIQSVMSGSFIPRFNIGFGEKF